MIRRDDLQYRGLILYQDSALDCFSGDAVLLANYLSAAPSDRVIELGAGNGVVSILGAAKTGARFTGVELQEAQCLLAQRSARENGQEIDFLCMDVSDAPAALGCGAFTLAVMNPPYFTDGQSGPNPSRAAARHGEPAVLDTFLHAAFLLLQNGGKLSMIYPASQAAFLFSALRAHRLEPKHLQIASLNGSRVPTRILVTAKKDGRTGLVWDALPE